MSFTPGDPIPSFSGGRNITQPDGDGVDLDAVLQGHDDAIVGGVAASLSSSAPVDVGLAAAAGGTGTTASKSGHTHRISAALAALIEGSITFVVGAEDAPSSNDIVITGQVKDALGSNLARTTLVQLWLADTDVATPGTAVTTLTVTTGTPVLVQTTALKLLVLTDATGAFAVKLNIAGANARYLNAVAGGIAARSGAATWTS